MQNITSKEIKHLCNFLSTVANYKVTLVSNEDFAYDDDWKSATEELCTQTNILLNNYFNKDNKTYATAIATAIKYRYYDDCINDGIAEMFYDYCKQHNILEFYFKDKNAHNYDGVKHVN